MIDEDAVASDLTPQIQTTDCIVAFITAQTL
jgi:hypothetical protein